MHIKKMKLKRSLNLHRMASKQCGVCVRVVLMDSDKTALKIKSWGISVHRITLYLAPSPFKSQINIIDF